MLEKQIELINVPRLKRVILSRFHLFHLKNQNIQRDFLKRFNDAMTKAISLNLSFILWRHCLHWRDVFLEFADRREKKKIRDEKKS